jgi:predicted DNA-binding protein
MSSFTVSITISDRTKARLAALAEHTGRSSSFLAAEAIDAYIATG